MGAYLSTPVRDKISEDEESQHLRYGASSMQGWRISQEDAHNCCLDFDNENETSLFAVYDGHGGAEVAQYAALHLPDHIREDKLYEEHKLGQALEECFLSFDEKLLQESVMKELKELAGTEPDEEENDEEQEKETAMLFEEADMPLEKLLERYKGKGATPPSAATNLLRKKDNFLSPVVVRKQDGISTDENSNKTMGQGEQIEDGEDNVKTSLFEKIVNGHSENSCDNVNDTSDSKVDTESKKCVTDKAENDIKPAVIEAGCIKKSSQNNQCDYQSESLPGVDEDGCKSEQRIEQSLAREHADSTDLSMENSDNITDTKDKAQQISSSNSCNEVSSSAAGADHQDSKSTTPENKDMVASSNEAGSSEAIPATVGETIDNATEGCASSSSSHNASAGGSSSMDIAESSCQGGEVGGSTMDMPAGSLSAETGGSTSVDVPAGSSSQSEDQPSSSTGRTHRPRKNIIPEDDEDESSMSSDDEDDEDEWDTSDEENLCEPDSEDDNDDEMDEEGDEDEDEADVMSAGEEPGMDSGCTAVVALLRGKELYVANAGDSRCVVCRKGKAIDMSIDHKPEDTLERNRIVAAGGRITQDGRVNGGLNLSRAIGDHSYKQNGDLPLKDQMITALPDIRTLTLQDDDEFMVLACDGIWNVMTSQDVVGFVQSRLQPNVKLSLICEELFEFCLAPDSTGDGTGCDNMTCMIVTFDKLHGQQIGTSQKRAPSPNTDCIMRPDSKRQRAENDEQGEDEGV